MELPFSGASAGLRARLCCGPHVSVRRIVVTYLMSYLYDDPTAKAARGQTVLCFDFCDGPAETKSEP